MDFYKKTEGIRIIKTARTVEEMNTVVLEGYWPLLYQNSYDKEVNEYVMMYQHPETQLCQLVKDYRLAEELESLGYCPLLKNHKYLPDFPPFAAYLIPKDIQQGEVVWVEDVIETEYRHDHGKAAVKGVWNGSYIRLENDFIEKILEELRRRASKTQ